MGFRQALLDVGIKLPEILAGMGGGIVNSFVFKRSTPVSIIGSVVVGAITANYLGEHLAKIVGTSITTGAFLTGLAGMAICQGAVEALKRWRPINLPTDGGGNAR